MIDIKDKNITVFGLGKSGFASAKKLAQAGARVFVTEVLEKDKVHEPFVTELRKLGVSFEFGGHTENSVKNADIIIMSPGVRIDLPVIKEAKDRKVSVLSEIELAFEFLTKPLIAVTGTNGKTTVVTLIAKMLNDSGMRAIAAGNIGVPLISVVDDQSADIIVMEASSYQLETTQRFKPWISVILNITEDHTARHGTMEEYAKAKSGIFANQDSRDFLVYNIDDAIVAGLVKGARAKLFPFSTRSRLDEGVYLKNGSVVFRLSGREISICSAADAKIPGEHNIENICAASAAALIAGIAPLSVKESVSSFAGVEHRIEFVKKIRGVDFYNDSKATNPDSAAAALKALKDNVILIAGGRDKGGDLSSFCGSVKRSAKKVVLLGEAKERFAAALNSSGFNNILTASDMREAVSLAFDGAKPGDRVLLSPACASFDMFRDFEDRGRAFKEIVLELGGSMNKGKQN